MKATNKTPNKLIHEDSLYLQQHAYNPVQWYPWGEEALQKARKENKPIIVSIGYSSCHWCHVMERECFENQELAQLMNTHYICIKVDREERPDIDQIYMEAIQVMGINGGWPLNVFLTPETKPFYGGTYFPSKHWKQLLTQVAEAFDKHRDQLEASAVKFEEVIQRSELDKYELHQSDKTFSKDTLEQMYQQLSEKFDTLKGGIDKAPKFPMPTIWSFLCRYYDVSKNAEALKQLQLTLKQMAYGGIYDQIGGGFARYSVDGQWFAPHFEKMLYDNAQLVSLYAETYSITQNMLYKRIVDETITFLGREMQAPHGGFYSALDADTEGIEGRFYSWTYEELKSILPEEELENFCLLYQVTQEGNWEQGYNILHRKWSTKKFGKEVGISTHEADQKISQWKGLLLKARNQREFPGLDKKIITSWNGLMVKALADAYNATGAPKYLQMAKRTASFILDHLMLDDGQLWHVFHHEQGSIKGYLEDYACVIQGFITLYQTCFDTIWLEKAELLTSYTLKHFYNQEEGMFYFTDAQGEALIARKMELFDNVIPASNSIMAMNLYFLGAFLEKPAMKEISQEMLGKVNKMLVKDVQYLSNWASLYSYQLSTMAEVVIVGKQLTAFSQGIMQEFLPNKIVIGSTQASDTLPLLKGRTAINDRTTVYVCRNSNCQLPVHSLAEALKNIKGGSGHKNI
ncbi:thioredoxin domain-containing protein [Algivirga pacifica]|uniref:Thioredoxin domain-containing protein n=1 Tax=Algivirga pacifica TaxID=1162670 RepID=A0ABP9DCT9_9BACT